MVLGPPPAPARGFEHQMPLEGPGHGRCGKAGEVIVEIGKGQCVHGGHALRPDGHLRRVAFTVMRALREMRESAAATPQLRVQ